MQKKWGVFIAVYLGSIAATINQFKVPPLMETLMENFNLSIGIAGWLMSIFAVAGISLALPLGVILHLSNIKKIGKIGLIFLTVGALLGSLATGAKLLLLGRMFEGFGLLTMGIVAPVFINNWFPQSKRGLPMGIWTTWIPVGSIIMFNLTQPLSNSGSWRISWWFGFVVALIALLIYLWVAKLPDNIDVNTNVIREFNIKAFQNKQLWLLALMFATYCCVIISYTSWAPVYLKSRFEISTATAAFYTSLIHVGFIPSNIIAGWVIQKLNSYRKVYTVGFILLLLLLPMAFNLQERAISLFMLSIGLTGGFIPTAAFTAAPDVIKKKEYLGLASGTMIWAQNLGLLIGPVILGKLYSLGDWQTAGYFLIIMAILGFTIGQFIKVR